MPLNLSEIMPIAPRKVTLRGVTYEMHPVTGRKQLRLQRQWARPGPNGEPYNRCEEGTPQHTMELEKFNAIQRVGLIGIALNITNAAGEEWNEERRYGWVDSWVGDILARLTEQEIVDLWCQVTELNLPSRDERIGTENKLGN